MARYKHNVQDHNNQNCCVGSHIIPLISVLLWTFDFSKGGLTSTARWLGGHFIVGACITGEEVNLEQAAKRSVLTKGRDEIMETPLPPFVLS